jgi:hypothetical protein
LRDGRDVGERRRARHRRLHGQHLRSDVKRR